MLSGFSVNSMHLKNEQITLSNLIRAAVLHFIAGDNDYYVSTTAPVGNFTIGDVWFKIDDKTGKVTVMSWEGKQWITSADDLEFNLHVLNSSFDIEYGFGCVTFYHNPKWTQATEFTQGVTYYVLNDGEYKIAVSQPNVDTDFTSNTYYFADNVEYVVYTNNGTPYVSYSRSQGLYLAKMNVIKEKSDMNNPQNFSKEDLINLSPFIREDEYNDSNFLLTSYESEEEQMSIKQSLLERGIKELKKIYLNFW